jgi:purine-binding chemotaxis protein CheW
LQANGKTNASDKFLTFSIADEVYGIEILKVREIIAVPDITPVPQTPNFVKGVINLRGKVIALIDLREKLGFAGKEIDENTCIIIVFLQNRLIGLLVDRVKDVSNITEENIEETPSFGTQIRTEFIQGIGKVKREDSSEEVYVVILLDIDQVLTSEEFIKVAEIGGPLEETKESS